MRVLAIVPARGGSKGVPGKNLADLGGKPLVQHAVDCALMSKNVDRIVLTSDSQEILDGVSPSVKLVKIARPSAFASDSSSVVTAVNHVLETESDFDIIVLLQPTSPLRTSANLDAVIGMFSDPEVDAVISVISDADIHPARMYSLSTNGTLQSYLKEAESVRRQDLPEVYLRNGCFYAIRTEAFKNEQTFMANRKKAYLMDNQWLANVDSPRDLIIVRAIFEEWKSQNS